MPGLGVVLHLKLRNFLLKFLMAEVRKSHADLSGQKSAKLGRVVLKFVFGVFAQGLDHYFILAQEKLGVPIHLVLELLERPGPKVLKVDDVGILIFFDTVLYFLYELLLAFSAPGFDLGEVDHFVSL